LIVSHSRFRFRIVQNNDSAYRKGPLSAQLELTRAIENVSQKINKAFGKSFYVDAKEIVGYEQGEGTENDWYNELFHEVLLGLVL
jgi:hypothetical protein